MKKSLFAIAAVTAFAGAAQAQSSVTVYGLIDFGYAGASQTRAGGGTSAAMTAANNIVTKTQSSGIAGDGESTSRLGFRGTEDLGGGLNAFFTAEAAINMAATGNSNASGLFSATSTGQRQLFIGLGKKGLGAASFGTQYTPVHEAVTATNAGGGNNQMGDVIYDRRGNGVDYTNSGMSTNDSYTVRTTNALILKSERMSGFGIKGMVVAAGRTANQVSATAGAGGESSNEGYGLGVDYQWKKLYVTANYQMFRNNTSTGAAAVGATNLTPALSAQNTTFAPGYNGGAVTPGVNSQDSQQYYGATYDFGILKAFVGYVNRKATNVNDNTNYVSRTAQQIGVRAPITPVIQVWASGGTGKINSQGSAGTAANITGWQIGSDYNLSKRTNLYAIYGISATSNANIGAYASPTVPTTQTSFNQSSYAVGVRHTF